MKRVSWQVRALVFAALILSAPSIIASLLPFSTTTQWYVRICDFPRIQIVTLLTTSLILVSLVSVLVERRPVIIVWLCTICACIGVQTSKLLPFLPISAPETLSTTTSTSSPDLKVLVANVLYKNKDSGKLKKRISSYRPDLLLLCEVNERWIHDLKSLHSAFPYRIHEPRADGHGIALWSTSPLIDATINHLVTPDRPSVSAIFNWKGRKIQVWGLHPAPPGIQMETGKRKNSGPRDAELLLVAKKIKARKNPVIVLGDFNDTGWSKTTSSFKNLSDLTDPRVGRGIYNTYPVAYPLFRFPIDHIFVSSEFRLRELQRLDDIGSDHFPIGATLTIDEKTEEQEAKDSSEKLPIDTEERINKGQKQAERYADIAEEDTL